MTTIKFELPDLIKHYRTLGQKLPAALQRGMLSGGLRALTVVQQATRTARPANPKGLGEGGAVNYGHYLRSWKMGQLPGNRGVRIFNDAPYAGVIELGRRRGARMPPIEAIARWAQRRLKVKTTLKSGKNKGAPITRSMKRTEALEAAYLIARAIKRRGLRARYVMGSAEAKMRRVIFHEVMLEYRVALSGGTP